MLKLVVLISGNGSNLQAIIDAIASGFVPAKITGVLSNKADAYGLHRAQQASIPNAHIDHRQFNDREEFDRVMIAQIDQWQADIVVLAGFMRILTPSFVNHFQDRLINIHPSLLPEYKGLHTHKRALEDKRTSHGCSVHSVTAELDDGPIIAQAITPIFPHDTEETLANRVHLCEHFLYPQVLKGLATQEIKIQDNSVYYELKPLHQPIRYVAQLDFEVDT